MLKSAHKNTTNLLINILYPQGVKMKLPIKFLKWLISYGRFIVILVEIVVLTTFAYRFKLDADLANIKNQIESQVPFLESLASDEILINQTQLKIATIKKHQTLVPNWQSLLDKISSQLPAGVKINTLYLEPSKTAAGANFRITAQANSNNDVSLFLSGLKKEKSFKDISLTNINFEQSGIILIVTGVSTN